MPATRDILASIESRIRDVSDQIERLTRARAALDGLEPVTPSQTRRTRSKTPTRRGNPTRRTTRQKKREAVSAGKLERLLSGSDGLTTAALAERANTERDQVLTLLRELEAAGKVRRTGQRRGTRWRAVTDEDRTNKRAAELAARSTKQSAA